MTAMIAPTWMTAVNAVTVVVVDGQAEHLLGDREVAGARDRQELGEPLDDAENDRLEEVHAVSLLGRCLERVSNAAQRLEFFCRASPSNGVTFSVVTPASAKACSRSGDPLGGPSSEVWSMNSSGTAAIASRCSRSRIEVLHLRGLGFEAHPAGELVVEVLLPAAHAADVQRGVARGSARRTPRRRRRSTTGTVGATSNAARSSPAARPRPGARCGAQRARRRARARRRSPASRRRSRRSAPGSSGRPRPGRPGSGRAPGARSA